MLGIQMLGVHNMAVNCMQHAFIPEQPFDVRQEYMKQATKLSRTYADLLRTLQAFQGEGSKKTSVGTVNVSDNAQAVIGNVGQPNGGEKKTLDELHEQ